MLSGMQRPKPIAWKRLALIHAFGLACFFAVYLTLRSEQHAWLLVILPILAIAAALLDHRKKPHA
jgi:hypothetical protein